MTLCIYWRVHQIFTQQLTPLCVSVVVTDTEWDWLCDQWMENSWPVARKKLVRFRLPTTKNAHPVFSCLVSCLLGSHNSLTIGSMRFSYVIVLNWDSGNCYSNGRSHRMQLCMLLQVLSLLLSSRTLPPLSSGTSLLSGWVRICWLTGNSALFSPPTTTTESPTTGKWRVLWRKKLI